MSTLIDDYLREVEASLRTTPERKRTILDELRGHLVMKMVDLRAREPDLPEEDAARRVIADLGGPRELALAYTPEGEVLQNRAGETVLQVGRAVGRGTARVGRAAGRGARRALKVFAVVLGVLVVLGIGVGAWAYYELRPVALKMAEDETPLYEFDQTCAGTPCNGGAPADVFHVREDAKRVRLEFGLSHAYRYSDEGESERVGNGSVTLRVADPEGNTRLERTMDVTNRTSLDQALTWASSAGNWTVAVTFTGFQGDVWVRAYAETVYWSDL